MCARRSAGFRFSARAVPTESRLAEPRASKSRRDIDAFMWQCPSLSVLSTQTIAARLERILHSHASIGQQIIAGPIPVSPDRKPWAIQEKLMKRFLILTTAFALIVGTGCEMKSGTAPSTDPNKPSATRKLTVTASGDHTITQGESDKVMVNVMRDNFK